MHTERKFDLIMLNWIINTYYIHVQSLKLLRNNTSSFAHADSYIEKVIRLMADGSMETANEASKIWVSSFNAYLPNDAMRVGRLGWSPSSLNNWFGIDVTYYVSPDFKTAFFYFFIYLKIKPFQYIVQKVGDLKFWKHARIYRSDIYRK